MPRKRCPEFRARALQLIEERIQDEQCSGWVACTVVGRGSPRRHLTLHAAELDRPTTR